MKRRVQPVATRFLSHEGNRNVRAGRASSVRALGHGGEGIAPTCIAANVLRRITVEDLTPEHGVREAPNLVLDGEQLATRLGMHDLNKSILIGAAFLSHQVMLL